MSKNNTQDVSTPIDNFINKVDSFIEREKTVQEIYESLSWDGETYEFTISGLPTVGNPDRPLVVDGSKVHDNFLHAGYTREITLLDIISNALLNCKITHDLDKDKVDVIINKQLDILRGEMKIYNKVIQERGTRWTFPPTTPNSRNLGESNKASALRNIVKLGLLSGQSVELVASKINDCLGDGNDMSIHGQVNNLNKIIENISISSAFTLISIIKGGKELTENHIKNIQVPKVGRLFKVSIGDELFDL